MRRILVTGALGQIGSELVPALRQHYGAERVVASDSRITPAQLSQADGVYEHLDCTQSQQIFEVMRRHDIGTVYHLAALLSAVAEQKPHAAWSINTGSVYNLLEAARQYRCQGLCHVVENWVRFCRNSATITPQRRLHATSAWPMPGRLGAFLLR